ncbi:hypothetical protein Tco_0697220 [Tanacetum coccineum]
MIHNLVVLDLQKEKDAQAKEIAALKKRIQGLERRKISRPTGLKRLRKVSMSQRVESSEDQESLGVPEDAFKQGRSIADIDADVEMHVEAKVDGKDEQSTKTDDSTAGEAVTTAGDDSVQQLEDPRIKRKDQIAFGEQITRDIQAKLDGELLEEQKLARKQEEEANIALIESWENTQAMMEADRLLAERLQSKEREELTDEEKAKLFMELMEKRRKHFAALRAQEKRNRPPTKAQKRTQMSTYLKHMAMGSEVQENKEKKEEGREETAKGSRKKMLGRKRAGKEQQKESLKKQKVEEEKESEEVKEDDEVELLKLMMMNIKFRGGLLGLKRLHGFLEVTAAQVHNGNYAKCAAHGKIACLKTFYYQEDKDALK